MDYTSELLVGDEIWGYEYEIVVTCSNCGWSARTGVCKGDTIEWWLGFHWCPKCKCLTLTGKAV